MAKTLNDKMIPYTKASPVKGLYGIKWLFTEENIVIATKTLQDIEVVGWGGGWGLQGGRKE